MPFASGGGNAPARTLLCTAGMISAGIDSVRSRVSRSATNVTCSVVIETDQANHAMDLLRQCQGRSVVVIASGLPRYDFLSTVGDVSGDITVDSYGISRINLKIEGNVQ